MASSSLIMGNNMHVKYLAGIVGAALLMAGCSSSNQLTAAGQSVRFVEDKPGAECQLIGTATGKQSNWLSGQHGEEGGSMRGAANDLRNQAAAMGGNVIYGVSSPTQGMLSSFVPTASEMNGQVYKCPN
ncbi:lipoprotein [Citrobacter koseri]|nr:lipoprotein [Citrobacter koseri]SQB05524.1 lipoprotein [Citrobacter koseri]SQB25742.1 lipoprotein [Citrobacter koseri]SQB44060.1 lipoprotein [Citrobacter koseri]STB50493.1 lipoprotein [Citrobacter koseri]